MSWAYEFFSRGTANIVLYVLWWFVLCIGIAGLILYALHPTSFTSLAVLIFVIIMSVYKIFFYRLELMAIRYKTMSKAYGVTEWMRTTEFSDDEIVLTDHNSVTTLRYDLIKKIKEKDNIVIIFLDGNMGLRLYKDAFTEGSWEECRALIDSKVKLK